MASTIRTVPDWEFVVRKVSHLPQGYMIHGTMTCAGAPRSGGVLVQHAGVTSPGFVKSFQDPKTPPTWNGDVMLIMDHELPVGAVVRGPVDLVL